MCKKIDFLKANRDIKGDLNMNDMIASVANYDQSITIVTISSIEYFAECLSLINVKNSE